MSNSETIDSIAKSVNEVSGEIISLCGQLEDGKNTLANATDALKKFKDLGINVEASFKSIDEQNTKIEECVNKHRADFCKVRDDLKKLSGEMKLSFEALGNLGKLTSVNIN